MSWMPKKYNIEMIVLTPVHVGSGEIATPFEYVLLEDYVEYFDSSALLQYLIRKNDLTLADIENGNYRKLREKISDTFSKNNEARAFIYQSIPIYSDKFLADYANAIKSQESDKQMQLDRMTHNNIEKKIVIPGSSIKGSIRTAVISYCANFKDQKFQMYENRNGKDHYTEKPITGGIDFDPFKNIIFRDISIESKKCGIVAPIEIKKNPEKQSTPKNFVEAVMPMEHTLKSEIIFNTNLDFKKTGVVVSDLKQLIKIVNDFYYPKFIEEYNTFYKRMEIDEVEDIFDYAKELQNQGWSFLRVGHYSHGICCTLDNYRKPWGQFIKALGKQVTQTTRTLADGELPFGWIAIKEIP